MLIISTATVSLLLVGVLALLMTPSRTREADDSGVADGVDDSGLAIVTDFVTFAPAAGSPDSGPVGTATGPVDETTVDATDGPAVVGGRSAPDDRIATTPAPSVGFGTGQATSSGLVPSISVTIAGAAVVTPLGNGLAVTTESALGGAAGSFNAVLPTGERVIADVITATDGVVFVAVAGMDDGMAIAPEASDPGSLYLSIGGTTMPIDSRALASMVIPEATPVIDVDGDLVGLCTYGPDGIQVVPVGEVPELTAPTVPDTDAAPDSEPAVSSLPPAVDPAPGATSPATEPDASTSVATSAAVTTSTSSSTTSSVPGR